MKKAKLLKKILIIGILLVIYTYVMAIQAIPSDIVLFEGEQLNLRTILGLKVNLTEKDEVVETLSNNQNKTINEAGKKTAKISLFENIFLKDVNIDVLPKTTVIPVGNIAGIKLYTSGVLVVGMSEIEGVDSKKYKPYENTGIEEGDTITSIDNKKILSTEDLVDNVNASNGYAIEVEYVHEDKTMQC